MMKKLLIAVLCIAFSTSLSAQTTIVSYTEFDSWSYVATGGDSNGRTKSPYLEETADGGCAYFIAQSPVFSTVGYENLSITVDIDNNRAGTFSRLEYSPDGGTNWYPIGSSAEGINWYNNTSGCSSSNDGFEGWEGIQNVSAELFCLNSNISNNPNARIRAYLDMWNDGGYTRMDNIIISGSAIVSEDLSSGPGGVTSGLKTWLRADKEIGFLTEGAPVDTWDDKVKNNSAFIEQASDSPTFYNRASENVNFNPVLDFDGTQSLRACAGLHTQDIFVVTEPASTVNGSSAGAYVLSIDDPSVTFPTVDISGIHFGNTTSKLSNEVLSYNLGTTTTGYGAGQTSGSYSTPIIINAGNNSAANGMDIYANGALQSTMQVNAGSFANQSDTKFWLARGESTSANYAGKIMEVISFNSRLNDNDRQKVGSYLAIKYGITLGGNGTGEDYRDATGNVFWDATAAGSFNYDIFGIGRDDISSLDQKQSKSVNSASVLTLSLGDVATTNDVNPNSFANDQAYVTIASNGIAMGASTSGTFDLGYVQPPYTALSRKWRVQERNSVGNVKLSIAESDITSNLSLASNEEYIFLSADDENFTTNVSVESLTLSGSNYEVDIDFPANDSRFFTYGKVPLHIASAHVDFDGNDDYVEADGLMAGYGNATIMGWVKLDNTFSTSGTIFGQRILNIGVDGSLLPYAEVINNTSISPVRMYASNIINREVWAHIAVSYSGTLGTLKLYVNGELSTETSVATGVLSTNNAVNGNLEIGGLNGSNFLRGNIDELRVFNAELTADQIQKMVYQEIQDNGGSIRGKTIPRDVEGTAWSSLQAYYDLNLYKAISIVDQADNASKALFRNFDTSVATQGQTAPMPFRATAPGSWTDSGTWEHSTIWDVHTGLDKDWSVVQISADVDAAERHSTLGLIVDANRTLTLHGDNELANTWYLSLEGTIDLQQDSQLVQTQNSMLSSTAGRVRRRQEGTANAYWYNFLCSPVGNFSLDGLKDGTGAPVQYTSATDQPGRVSTRWLYTFQNGVGYYDWQPLATAEIVPTAVGWSQKGTGTSDPLGQQYIFEGPPNNGTILLAASDIGGPGSVENLSKTEYLVGNPYPSAMRVDRFIDDNAGVIDGKLQFWQQWAGASHVADQYQGGYATVNKLAGTRAYQAVGAHGGFDPTQQNGTLTPTGHIPVAQGFVVEVVGNGNIEFNNGQRTFVREADYDGVTYDDGSAFFRAAPGADQLKEGPDQAPVSIMRLQLTMDGRQHRELVLGFSQNTTDGFDFGYDARTDGLYDNDMALVGQDGQHNVIEAFAPITQDKEIPIALKARGDHQLAIAITSTQHIDDRQEIYLWDKYLDLRHDLAKAPYEFTSDQGVFTDRLAIVFAPAETLSSQGFDRPEPQLAYDPHNKHLHVTGLPQDASLRVFNMLGQSLMGTRRLQANTTHAIDLSALPRGAYIAQLEHQGARTTIKMALD